MDNIFIPIVLALIASVLATFLPWYKVMIVSNFANQEFVLVEAGIFDTPPAITPVYLKVVRGCVLLAAIHAVIAGVILFTAKAQPRFAFYLLAGAVFVSALSVGLLIYNTSSSPDEEIFGNLQDVLQSGAGDIVLDETIGFNPFGDLPLSFLASDANLEFKRDYTQPGLISMGAATLFFAVAAYMASQKGPIQIKTSKSRSKAK